MEIRKFAQAQPQAQAPQAQASKLNVPISPNRGVATPQPLPENIVSVLNDRIGDEYTAYYFYRNAANWCKEVNYKKAAAFFESEAEAELEHSKGLQDYLTQWNIIPTIPQVQTSYQFTGLIEIINKAYELELDLLHKYSENQQSFLSEHTATFNFIQKYVDYQNDEVAEYADLLNGAVLVDYNDKFQLLYFEQTYF